MINLAIDLFRQPYQIKEYTYDRHKDVIKKLKFISKIEVGERINVHTVSTSQSTMFSSIYRSIFKESRIKTFQFLNDIVDRSFELIVLYQDSTKIADRITCSQILEDLYSSVAGLKNLQITYSEDRNFYCDIDTLISSIFARLVEIYEKDHVFVTDETKQRIRSITLLSRIKSKDEKKEKEEKKEEKKEKHEDNEDNEDKKEEK
jgi:hypothetical protein